MDTTKILIALAAAAGAFFLYKTVSANASTGNSGGGTYLPGTTQQGSTNGAKKTLPGVTYKSKNIDVNLPPEAISKGLGILTDAFGITGGKKVDVKTPTK